MAAVANSRGWRPSKESVGCTLDAGIISAHRYRPLEAIDTHMFALLSKGSTNGSTSQFTALKKPRTGGVYLAVRVARYWSVFKMAVRAESYFAASPATTKDTQMVHFGTQRDVPLDRHTMTTDTHGWLTDLLCTRQHSLPFYSPPSDPAPSAALNDLVDDFAEGWVAGTHGQLHGHLSAGIDAQTQPHHNLQHIC